MSMMADIFRRYGKAYLAKYGNRMLTSHKNAIYDIIHCRTEDMGGRVYRCPDHDEVAYKYHSCMNRNCPQCQNDQAERWLQKQRKRLINVQYFLVTFTLPKELRPIARSNQKLFYRMMFYAAVLAMKKLARNPRFIGGNIGCMGILHTWTRTLEYHPHIHFLIPAGGLSDDKSIWLPAGQKKFLFPVQALMKIYRAIIRDQLKTETDLFSQISNYVWFKGWVVHCMPAGNGETVLKYFAPYVFRVAISNNRIIKFENGNVTFAYRDSKTNKWKKMTLPVFEFMRRFLQHVLPQGFKKVRYYGFLNSGNKELLLKLQYTLGTVEPKEETSEDEKQTQSPKPCCPVCGKEMILCSILLPEKYNGSVQKQAAPP
jgi:hypothetical protein